MTNYSIADFLIRLKNASLAGVKQVTIDKTKLILAVANTLKKERYLDTVSEKDGKIVVTLSIFSKKAVLSDVKIVSKPGRRVYINVDELEKKKTPEMMILTTPKGVMSDKDAKKARLGGEVIATII